MDFIKNWGPPFNTAVLVSHLPSISSPSTNLTQNFKEESYRLLNQISCHFFDRSKSSTSNAEAPPTRRTIQTNYISTISSLVDQERAGTANAELRRFDANVAEDNSVQRGAAYDAQSDNYGLYALKRNRNGVRARGARVLTKVAPPVPPPPAARLGLAVGDIRHEQFQSIEHKHTLSYPRQSKRVSPRRPNKKKAPVPLPIQPKPAAAAKPSAAMVLDTELLEPNLETVADLSGHTSSLYRIANQHVHRNSLADGVHINQPKIENALSHSNHSVSGPLKSKSRRQRLLKQYSTTESVNIFARQSSRDEDVFEDFTEAISLAPKVSVLDAHTSRLPIHSVEYNDTAPTINYAARFAAAFAEAFPDDGLADVDPFPSPQPSPTLPPTNTNNNHAAAITASRTPPNLITNSSSCRRADHDNNTDSEGDVLFVAPTTTQLRSFGDSMRPHSSRHPLERIDENTPVDQTMTVSMVVVHSPPQHRSPSPTSEASAGPMSPQQILSESETQSTAMDTKTSTTTTTTKTGTMTIKTSASMKMRTQFGAQPNTDERMDARRRHPRMGIDRQSTRRTVYVMDL